MGSSFESYSMGSICIISTNSGCAPCGSTTAHHNSYRGAVHFQSYDLEDRSDGSCRKIVRAAIYQQPQHHSSLYRSRFYMPPIGTRAGSTSGRVQKESSHRENAGPSRRLPLSTSSRQTRQPSNMYSAAPWACRDISDARTQDRYGLPACDCVVRPFLPVLSAFRAAYPSGVPASSS